jgi:hypothetical protein
MLAGAGILVGCPDWDSFTSGNGTPLPGDDAGFDASDDRTVTLADGGVDGGHDGGNADSGTVSTLSIEIADEADGTFDLTKLGKLDWLEAHEVPKSAWTRCGPCPRSILELRTPMKRFSFGDDGRRAFTWSNGTPDESGTMNGGLYVEEIGSAFVLDVAPNGTPELLSLHLNTYFAGAKVEATVDGLTKSVDLKAQKSTPIFLVRVRFRAPATAKLVVTYSETTILTPEPGEVPNIAFSAVTLAGE